MKKTNSQSGFSTVELLITLFIAAAFLMSGFQLYSLIMKDGGEAKAQAIASNIAYDYLQRYKTTTVNPCVGITTPIDNEPVIVDELMGVTATVTITCPYDSLLSISKVESKVLYGSPQKTIIISTYVKP